MIMIMRNNNKAVDDNVGEQVRGGAPSARGQPAAVPPPPRLPPLHHPQGRAQPGGLLTRNRLILLLLTISPGQGSFLDLINTSYEPFIALLAAAGAVASFFLFQAINNAGRRRRRDLGADSVGLLYGELTNCLK